jgi:hypothetical protein
MEHLNGILTWQNAAMLADLRAYRGQSALQVPTSCPAGRVGAKVLNGSPVGRAVDDRDRRLHDARHTTATVLAILNVPTPACPACRSLGRQNTKVN